MRITYPTTAHAEATVIRLTLPVDYDDDLAELQGCPGLDARVLVLDLHIDERRVLDWDGTARLIHLKVCDQGRYVLLDESGKELAVIDDWYVPRCVPQEYGDYVVLDVSSDGTLPAWRPSDDQIVACFWPEDD